jgi:large subunit ribosomal protein L25
MAEVKLKVVKREGTGKGVARRTRAEGRVPAVVYGPDLAAMPISVDRREFVTALHTDAGMNVLLSLEVDGKSIPALAKELQRDPVRGTLLHADFIMVDLKQEVEVEVPVHIVGEAQGAKEGGVLEQPLFTVTVRCLPTEVPEQIEADVSHLNIGDSLRVSELAETKTFHILNEPEDIVASVAQPISEEELEAMEAGVTAEAPEAEAAAEGEVAEETEEAGEGAESTEAPAPDAGGDEG